jgi:hypothetical protein
MKPQGIDEIVMQLNEIVSHADAELGCPFKAISYHGNLNKKAAVWEWEMIVDV